MSDFSCAACTMNGLGADLQHTCRSVVSNKAREFWIKQGTNRHSEQDIIWPTQPTRQLEIFTHVIEATPKTLAAEEMFEALKYVLSEAGQPGGSNLSLRVSKVIWAALQKAEGKHE